ncbi:MAG: RloB family protein, partial [Gammaproteobacteria bacterium]
MGSDDLFNKRKAKKVNSLERRKASRSSYNRVLIVCEGEKTEPNYFKELVQHYKLHTANVEVDGSCGSSPRSVFNRARELWEKEKRKGDPYDRVYCVFDKDTHETYEEALTNISRKEYKDIFHATTSVPSFEYWLLLHYKFTTKPYAASGKHSVADEVINELREVMPD